MIDFDNTQFHGGGYDKKLDHMRLTAQVRRTYELMIGGSWRTLREISDAIGAPEASVSAGLRTLRNQYNFVVDKRRRGEPGKGCWEYQVRAPLPAATQPNLF